MNLQNGNNKNDYYIYYSNYVYPLAAVVFDKKKGEKAILIHQASSSSYEREGQNDQSLLHYFDKKSNSIPREAFYEKLLLTPDKRLPTQSFKLRVVVNSYTVPVLSSYTVLVGEEVTGEESRLTITAGMSINQLDKTEEVEKEEVIYSIPIVGSQQTETETETETEIVEYLVMVGLMGGEARRVACDESSRHLKLVPLGAVAACISRRGRTPDPNMALGSGPCFPPIAGQAFWFLPLPVRTQLPVHTNAYWELSANRRDRWR